MTIFERIFHGGEVERAALATLRKWLPTYLAEIERQTDRVAGSLPLVRSWTTVNEFSAWPEDQLPCVLLVSTGLASEPAKDGAGTYRASWALGVAVVVSAAKAAQTMELARIYTAAIRAVLLQHPSLGGVATVIDWIDERYDDLPSDAERSLAAGQGIYRVGIDGVTTTKAGPGGEPRPDRFDPYDPTVAETVTVTVQPEDEQ